MASYFQEIADMWLDYDWRGGYDCSGEQILLTREQSDDDYDSSYW